MLEIDYNFNLNESVSSGQVSIGHFDGKHPSIAAVTRSDKIFVHNPHNRSNYSKINSSTGQSDDISEQSGKIHNELSSVHAGDLQFFHLNQTISCIAAGKISLQKSLNSSTNNDPNPNNETGSGLERSRSRKNASLVKKLSTKNNMTLSDKTDCDVLVIGTKTSIHVYDILQNCDLFYKEIPDGANSIVIGKYGDICDGNIMLVGGNCAIHGFDRAGNDVYWTVTGDNITSMALVDIDNDGYNELVVGSEDYGIQVFKNDAILFETTESDQIVNLVSLGSGLFGYGLANGTVGVYQANSERLWRIKSKNIPTCLFGLDVDQNGQIELITGWSNGKIDVRNIQTGEVYYRENFKTTIAGIVSADYNIDGIDELIIVNTSGEVFGLKLSSKDKKKSKHDTGLQQETIRELMRKKQTLSQELRNYEESQKIHQNLAETPILMSKGKMFNQNGDMYGAIPANTKIKSSLLLKTGQTDSFGTSNGCIELTLETTNDTQIRAAALFAEGVFKNESHVVCCNDSNATNSVQIELRPIKDMKIDLHIKALVGYRSSNHFHVFELARHLPRFSMYAFVRRANLEDNIIKKLLDFDSTTNNHDIYHIDPISDIYGEDAFKDSEVKHNVEETLETPKSFVKFNFVDQFSKIIEWININFLLDRELETNEMDHRIEFISMRNQKPLIIEFHKNKSTKNDNKRNTKENKPKAESRRNHRRMSTESEDFENIESFNKITMIEQMKDNSSELTIFTDSIELAGNIVQSLLGDFLAITNLACLRVHYPDEIDKLKQLIQKVEDIQNIRQHLLAEVADSGNLIRSTIVQYEDARLIEDYPRMRQLQNDLALMNRELMREHTIRVQNHKDLVESLKEINIIIQRASNLRVGSYKTALITSCREAIKAKYFNQLYKIICEEIN